LTSQLTASKSMTKLVILKFIGNLESGFQVNLEIGNEGESVSSSCVGSLPRALDLVKCLSHWQKQYNQLDQGNRIKPQQIIYDGSFFPQKQLIKAAKLLEHKLQQWLNSEEFSPIDRFLREELNRQDEIRLIICSDLLQLYQLPWCCWDMVEKYPQLEISLSSLNFERVKLKQRFIPHHKVRILAILGNNKGLNLDADRNFLASLDDGEVIFLVEPSPQELHKHLWRQTWDIIFFAGHSQTIDRKGILALNKEDNLTIEQLRYGFRQAISGGLQIAIFNSCDGLGLAEELGKLSLPQSIVMRLPIPDAMAQQFVKYFLQAYAHGDSLYLAMKQAREQLQGWEKQFPCTSWLPTIYQNPAVIPPSWKELRGETYHQTAVRPAKPLSIRQNIISVVALAAISTILVYFIQSWGILETSELKNYDRFIRWRPVSETAERILVITIEDEDIQYQTQRGMMMNMRGSLADETLEQLLTKLLPWQPTAIASDVIHDFPVTNSLARTISQTDDFFAICRVGVDQANLVSIAPPSPLHPAQLGFSNLVIDKDGGIRRQIIGMAPDQVCTSEFSLGLRLALKYLDNTSPTLDQDGSLQLGNISFPRLDSSSGGYQLPKVEAQGYQILLNYNSAPPKTISLKQILSLPESSLEFLVKDKIILIGVVGHNNDLHHTPYSQGQQALKSPGVIIHAQMTNHIINIVSGKQKLLRWFPDQIELLWIIIWSIAGSAIIIGNKKSFKHIILGIVLSFGLIFGCCWLLFMNGIWLIAIAPALALMFSAGLSLISNHYNDQR